MTEQVAGEGGHEARLLEVMSGEMSGRGIRRFLASDIGSISATPTCSLRCEPD